MTVVVGFAATPHGRFALTVAIDEAKHRGRQLVVVNSSKGDALADPHLAGDTDWDWAEASLDEAGIEYTVRREMGGRDAAGELLAVCHEVDATLCVIGLRRRSQVGKLLLGNNAHRILTESPCPVLSVRPGEPSTNS